MAVSALANAVRRMNCPAKPVFRTSRRKSIPDSFSIWMSEMMTSNSEVFSSDRPSSALAAEVTAKPSFFRKISSSSRNERSSSTIRSLAFVDIFLLAAPYRACIRSAHLKINDDRCAGALLRPHRYSAVMRIDNLINDRQPKTGAVLEMRVEWNEQPFEFFFRKSDACVFEANLRVAVAAVQRDRENSSVRHRFESIGREIIKHLPHHTFVRMDGNGTQRRLDFVLLLQLRTVPHELNRF